VPVSPKIRRLTAPIIEAVFPHLRVSPRFHTLEGTAKALAPYYPGPGTLGCPGEPWRVPSRAA
jgi:hypothetical protein